MQCAPKTASFPQRKLKSRVERSLPLPFIFLDTPMGCVEHQQVDSCREGWRICLVWCPGRWPGGVGVSLGPWYMDMCGRTQVDVG